MSADNFGTTSSPERARSHSWGGPEARAELRRLAEDARTRTGFGVSIVDVLRGDGFLEPVAFAGSEDGEAELGQSYPVRHMRRVAEAGTRYGKFVFLAEEDMDAELQEALRGHGYVPALPDSGAPDRWRTLDMLVATLTDPSGRTRALLHLDEPLSGRRPGPQELWHIADTLELVLQSVLVTVDREELTRHARLDETARAVVRAASRRLGGRDLLAEVHPHLVVGFRASSLVVRLHDHPQDLDDDRGCAADLPPALDGAIEAASRRAWRSRTVVIAEPGGVWGDGELARHHGRALADHLAAHDASELLVVPVGAGHEAMGTLLVVREGRENRWTEAESQAALGVGHDVGRALLSSRAHEREQQLIVELQQLDEYRRQLIDTVSHELKNPLGVILGHLEMLESVPDLPAEAQTSLAAMGRSAGRAQTVVNDLLLMSSVGTHDHTVGFPVDLGDVLAEVCADEALRAAQQGVVLRIAPGAGPLVVSGQGAELRSLVGNLVSNAVKYSDAGSAVDVSLHRSRDEVVLTCADHGLGISEDDRQRLFTEFFRSTNPDALQRPGTGLGLAIVARIADRHGAHIDVESAVGVGTTFRVRFPAAADDPAGTTPARDGHGAVRRLGARVAAG
ncbi:Signal transduction histidine kinase [Nocardioides scoriae]|uniref:Sensor-like histidine kinase SenX3 n=1 Tax=Nocardioides scoriae TaxID=642780 RepID=A0A1H1R6E6_9ACTN|nr:HAMP domain-containing sensor histidine kinase [Nocardioides scoriae]SDS31311.1 Signal transduction histidine kinase [Nocardioides scoriae]